MMRDATLRVKLMEAASAEDIFKIISEQDDGSA